MESRSYKILRMAKEANNTEYYLDNIMDPISSTSSGQQTNLSEYKEKENYSEKVIGTLIETSTPEILEQVPSNSSASIIRDQENDLISFEMKSIENIEIVDCFGNILKTIEDISPTEVVMHEHEGTIEEIEEEILNLTKSHERNESHSDVLEDTQNIMENTAIIGDIEEEAQNLPDENEENQTATNFENNVQINRTRKRKRNISEWKVNIQKRKCQAGDEYTSLRGKLVEARSVKTTKNCLQHCKFKCSKQISPEERKLIFNNYWSLTQNEKYVFLRETTKELEKCRKTTNEESRRKYSYFYFFKIRGEVIRVCKKFFLGTLNISQKPVYHAHLDGGVKKDQRGKTSSRAHSATQKMEIINHIKSFPVIESHYCRQSTERKYLEANLSVAKMYDLYVKWCEEKGKTPLKMSYYRHIFTTEFNFGFHIPKKDRCIKCESYKIKNTDRILTDEERQQYEEHVKTKDEMRKERNRDKGNHVPTLSFDLQNVITCPRSEVGDFFYLHKLSIYNLTGYFSTTGQTYCAIWNEATQGRSGNIIASAFRKILDKVLADNNVTELVTWSDSCVSQNRNSFISFAVLDALRENPDLQSVTMKYSVPRHGAIQEVDNIHSNIEKYMSRTEFFSPLSFIRNLKSVNKKRPYCILQLKDTDFKDFESCAKKLPYKNIPFSQVAALRFTQSMSEVEFKLKHSEDFKKETLKRPRAKALRGRDSKNKENIPQSLLLSLKPKVLPPKKHISEEKVNAIKKMMGCMPETDRNYFSAFLNELS